MRPKTLAAVAVTAAALSVGPAVAAGRSDQATASSPGGSTAGRARTAQAAGEESRVRQLIDGVRAQHGLRALRAERHLTRAARGHSADMRRRGYFAHNSPDGATPSDRIAAAGYRGATVMGETIAWGTGPNSTPDVLVRAWMRSRPHRVVLLSPRLRDIGVGVERAGDQAWITADFGARR